MMKRFSITRDRSRSVLAELRQHGVAQHDFLSIYPAREVLPDSIPMNVTQSYTIEKQALLYRDRKGAFLNNKYFFDIHSVSVAKISPSSSHILGKIRMEIDWELLLRFLIEADIICTYIHLESKMNVELISSTRAEVRGSHSYFTHTENEDPFAFAVEKDHTNTVHCFGV